MIEIIILILIALCGLFMLFFNEMEDESVRSNWKKYKQFLNKNLSWKNKWKWKDKRRIKLNWKYWDVKIWKFQFRFKFGLWTYLWILKPKYKERFIWSSTLFVCLTDGEHLFQFLKFRFIEIGFLIVSWQLVVAWIIGKSIMQFIKEKFIKWLT